MLFAQPFAGDCAGSHSYCGLTCGLPPTATIIANAVLLPIGIVGMAWPKRIANVAVVLAAGVDVADQQRDRRAGGSALEHAGENLNGIGFLTLGNMPRGPWPAAIEIALDVGFSE